MKRIPGISMIGGLAGLAAGFFSAHQSTEPIPMRIPVQTFSSSTEGAESFGSATASRPTPAAEIVEALSHASAFHRSMELTLLGERLSRAELRALLQAARRLPAEQWHEAMSALLPQWAARDPQGAASFALQCQESEGRAGAITNAVAGWARTDHAAAKRWFDSLPKQWRRGDPVRETLARSPAFLEDPATFLTRLNADGLGEEAFGLLRDWGAREPGTAANYARALPETQRRNEVLRSILDDWVRRDVREAYAWLLQSGDAQLRDSFAPLITAHLARTDPYGAVHFARSLPDELLRQQALSAAAGGLMDKSLSEAVKLIEELPFDPSSRAGIDLSGLGRARPSRRRSALS